jgi:hypothetical protein
LASFELGGGPGKRQSRAGCNSLNFFFAVVSFAPLVGFFGKVYFSLLAGSGLMRRKRSISERTEPSPSRTRRSSTPSSQRNVSQR